MKNRRLAFDRSYTRKEAAKILGVSERTVRRWDGTELHPIEDPEDGRHRRLYDCTEVESFARQRRRERELSEGAGTDDPIATRDAAVREKAGRDSIPGTKVSRGFTMLRDGHTVAEVCERLELSLEQGERLEEKFIAWSRRRAPGPPSPPAAHGREARLVLDPDPEMLRWQKEIDEESRRWEGAEDDETEDRGPPSTTRAA